MLRKLFIPLSLGFIPQTPTATVLLPAIPTWLPLWSLLSPHDARRGGNSEDERHEDGSSIPMGSTSAASGVDARPRGILSTTTDGKDCFGKQLPILKHCESDNQGSGNDEGEFMRAAEVGDADGQAGPVPWGRGAVGRIQVVAAGQAAYRFSAVLHFFDVVREGQVVSSPSLSIFLSVDLHILLALGWIGMD